jgi:hypothetical protein
VDAPWYGAFVLCISGHAGTLRARFAAAHAEIPVIIEEDGETRLVESLGIAVRRYLDRDRPAVGDYDGKKRAGPESVRYKKPLSAAPSDGNST